MAEMSLALVGAGSMGRNHARVISENPRARLAAIIDPFADAGSALAEQYGAKWRPELGELSDIDAVVIAASTEHHFALATEVISQKVPLLVEKPVCPSLAQTEDVVELSRRNDVPLLCGFLERYNPAVIAARRLMAEPVYIRAERHSPYAPRIKTGVAWDLLVHDVDLIAQLTGSVDPETVNVEVGRFHPSSLEGAEDVVDVSMRFGSGALASASASRVGQRKVRRLTVQSLDQMVEIDLLARAVHVYRHADVQEDKPGGSGYRQATEVEVPDVAGREPLASQLDRYLDVVNGDVDADLERESILPAHRIVDAALSRAQAGGVRL